MIKLFLILPLFMLMSCDQTKSPELTTEDKTGDILYLYKWAHEYSPFVKLNQQYKGCPNVDSLKDTYLELAADAEDNEAFFHVANGFLRLIGASGHADIPDQGTLNFYINEFSYNNPTDISIRQYQKAGYWARLVQEIPIFVHAPFQIKFQNGEYFVNSDWQHDTGLVPHGSKIITINGMSCSAFLDDVKQHTWIRHIAWNKGWIDKYLLLIDDANMSGWNVGFLLPDSLTTGIFVPKVKGFPSVPDNSANCTCLALADDAGYIRIRSFAYPHIENDGKLIKSFLDESNGKYRKLIIDIRNHGGGAPEYFYKNLISPFLDKPATYRQITGVRKKFLADMKPSHIAYLRKYVSTPGQGVVNSIETAPPAGFLPEEWTFFEITRTIEPSNRYRFSGSLYVLINGGSFSAADDYANAIKRTGLGILVGTNTGGGAAAYLAPVLVRLPASGMIFLLEADLLINPDGSFNELYGTAPDIKLDPMDFTIIPRKAELLGDLWIQKILAETGHVQTASGR